MYMGAWVVIMPLNGLAHLITAKLAFVQYLPNWLSVSNKDSLSVQYLWTDAP